MENVLNKDSFFWEANYLNISAWTEHIPFAFWLIEVLRPKIIVELGVHNGVSYFSFCQAVQRLNLNTACYGIDTWKGDEHSGFYDEEVFRSCSDYNNQEYFRFSNLIRSTFIDAKDYFIDETIELLHIDGLHSYEAVKEDFETWLPKLSPNCIVIFHDTNVRQNNFGVYRFWEELKQKYTHLHFDFGNGLGVISLGKVTNQELLFLFNENRKEEYYIFLRNLFSERGHSFKKKYEDAELLNQLLENLEIKKNELLKVNTIQEISVLSNENIIEINKELSIVIKKLKENYFNLELKISDINKREIKLMNNNDELKDCIKILENNINDLQKSISLNKIELNTTKLIHKDEMKKLSNLELLNRDLNTIIKQQQQALEWYKSTYVTRSFLGLFKENLLRREKKVIDKNHLNKIPEIIDVTVSPNKNKNFLPPILPFNTTNKQKFHLKPVNDIVTSTNLDEYVCVGPDPHFLVNFKRRQIGSGWYWLTVEIIEVQGIIFAPKLYFNFGEGFIEKNGWNLSSVKNGKIEGLVYIPSNLVELRFDPTTTKGTYIIKNFNFKLTNRIKVLKIGVYNYKTKYFPLESNSSFYKGIMKTFLKNGSDNFRKKIKETIYIDNINSSDKYKVWYTLYDTVSKEQYDKIVSLSKELSYQPLFSIIMPVYNAPISYLKKAIESVIDQPYSHWELCIADDKSTNEEVRNVLTKYSQKDARIKIVFRKTNGHISNASNSALELATGDYAVLLDQDDELSKHCLYMVAAAINKNKNLGVIYSDEDKIDEYGIRFHPYFKTDWNKDLFYGHNMISHLGVYKLSLIKKIGGFRAGYEGSQDYDLALRCIELLTPKQIYHIPHILYHWRAIEGSTALTISNKGYAYDASKKALNDHFKRTNQNVKLVELDNSHRVKWGLPKNKPLVSIIIPTKDKVDILSTCVESILEKTTYRNFEVLIIDNNSQEPETHSYLKKLQKDHKQIKVLSYKEEFNFSAMNNFGVKHSNGEILVLLNNDTSVINNDWLCEMVSLCIRKEVGAVGAKLFYPNGLIQHAGVILHEGHPGNHIYSRRDPNDSGYFGKLHLIQNYLAVTAACLAIRKELYLKVGGLDDQNLKVAYNDVDFCLKLFKLGFKNLWTPFAHLIHYESLSRGTYLDEIITPRFQKEHAFILSKWEQLINNDPFFNHNLGIDTTTTQFAFPPKIKYDWQA